jgi:predicted dehydrogenase
VKFHNGATLALEASWAGHLPDMEIFPQLLLGDRGGAVVNAFGGGATPLKIMSTQGEALVDLQPHGFKQVEAHIEEIKYWVGCVRGENEVLVKPEESLNVQRVIDAVYKSSETGREVLIDAPAADHVVAAPKGRRGKALEAALAK